jgi:hypothetical protein
VRQALGSSNASERVASRILAMLGESATEA